MKKGGDDALRDLRENEHRQAIVRSPADQIARCRDFATSRGWNVTDSLIVSDAGISGALTPQPAGAARLFARIGEWDVLLCWIHRACARL